jgi:hypothetical protein
MESRDTDNGENIASLTKDEENKSNMKQNYTELVIEEQQVSRSQLAIKQLQESDSMNRQMEEAVTEDLEELTELKIPLVQNSP